MEGQSEMEYLVSPKIKYYNTDDDLYLVFPR